MKARSGIPQTATAAGSNPRRHGFLHAGDVSLSSSHPARPGSTRTLRLKRPWTLPPVLLSLAGLLFSACAPAPGTAPEEALFIGSSKQLFLDDSLTHSMTGISRVLNQPVKVAGNPLLPRIPRESPAWDAGMFMGFSSVLYDEQQQLFKMWYGLHPGEGGDELSFLCYATSEDGIHWQKPVLGKVESGGGKRNNIVMPHSGVVSGVFIDERETDPDRRYKMLHMWQGYKVYASHSPDGLNWSPYNQGRPVLFIPPGHDSQMAPYWDPGLGKYVAIVRDRTGRIPDVRPRLTTDPAAGRVWRKLWDPRGERDPRNHTLRRVGQAVSDDFIHWTDYRPILGADAEDPLNRDQFYNMEVLVYDGLRVGLMTVFSYDPEYCRGAVQLTYSRDGRHWRRAADRRVFLPLSEKPGDFDWGSIYPLQAPLVVGDEIWIYYTGFGVDHNHSRPPGVSHSPNGIGLAKLRLDGFLSLEAGSAEGSVTTRPFTFEGERLMINAAAPQGRLHVEILGSEGLPLKGYGKADCVMQSFDQTRQVVSWQGKESVEPLAGQVIQLKFYLQKARLFSFGFGSAEGA